MIIKFKLFEGNGLEHDLVDDLSDDTIETYYDEKYKIDAKEICSEFGPHYIWDNFDDKKYIEDYIQDEIDNASLDEFCESDLRDYIENNLSADMKEKIIEIYKENNDDEDEDNEEEKEELEYEDSMLDDLTEDELKDVISNDSEYNFFEEIMNDRYGNSYAKDIISDFYDMEDGGTLYNSLYAYIDDGGVEKDFKNNEDFDYKKEWVENYINNDTDLQREILKNNPSAVLSLAELFSDSKVNENIGDEYEFQKLYIEKYVEGEAEDEYYKEHEEELHHTIAEALKFLYDNFGLDPNIEEEYKEDMWLISSGKYNL